MLRAETNNDKCQKTRFEIPAKFIKVMEYVI